MLFSRAGNIAFQLTVDCSSDSAEAVPGQLSSICSGDLHYFFSVYGIISVVMLALGDLSLMPRVGVIPHVSLDTSSALGSLSLTNIFTAV